MRMTTGDLGMVMPSRSIQSSYMSSSPSHSTGKKEEVVKDRFPAGLRVLVVDDDHMTLVILDRMLSSCSYTVTTCGKARAALELLRENKNNFDLVISDVYMPDMDGFKLLELVGLEMDLPVIMMSSDGGTDNVMKGITHGACDYLLKPVRMEELRNIWQHVFRKKAKEVDHASSQDNEKQKRGGEDGEHTSLTNSKKRKDVKEEEEDVDHDTDDPSSLKKPRVVWSVELHQQFVNAVNQLGIDKAVPKKILELMDITGLTRENVASHLQKYRLYLKRISVQQQQNGMNLSFGGPTEGGSEVRPLPGNSSFPMQHLGTVQQGVLGRLGNTNSLTSSSLDPSSLLQFVGIQGGPLFRPRLPSPVFSSQSNYLPTFTGGYQLEQTQQLSPFGAVAPTVDDVASLNTQVANTGKHSSMSNLGGLTGTFCTSQGSNSLIVQLLQQRQQPYAQHQGVSLAMGGGLGQHRNEVVNLGINTGLVDDIGYPTLGGINTAAGGGGNSALIENKNVGMLGVVDSNFPPASLNASAVPLATPVPPFDADAGGKISTLDSTAMQGLGQSLNAVANLNSGFGMAYNQSSIPGWQSQELGQISSPVVTPRYSQSVASQNFTGQSNVNAHEQKKMDLGRPGLRDSNSEQSTADSSFKPKAISGSLISAKLGLQIDQAPASDDLLSFYLKQEQQELGFPDNDLAFDGYIPDNLYVK